MQRYIEDLASQIRVRERFPAVGIAVSYKDNPICMAVDGVRRRGSSVPIQLADKWHIGSITKSITATIVGHLVDEGLLEFESAITDLLPDIYMHSLWAECTLEHLLTHTSGLPANFPNKIQKISPPKYDELVLSRRDVIQDTLSKPPKTPIGSGYSYSNIGYSIVGHIVETQTHSCFEELVSERFFRPCGLDSAGFGAPMGEEPDDQPMGHFDRWWYRKAFSPFQGSANTFKGRADNTPIISAAGRVHMNLSDLVKYGRMHLDGELGADSFLKAETWQRLHKPVMDNYACGWVTQESNNGRGLDIWHNGSNTLWYSFLLASPEEDIVLALVTNSGAIEKAENAFLRACEQISDQLD